MGVRRNPAVPNAHQVAGYTRSMSDRARGKGLYNEKGICPESSE